MLCRLTFAEALNRFDFFTETPPSHVYFFSGRINCGEKYFVGRDQLGGMISYAWWVWDYRAGRPQPGETRAAWINLAEEYEKMVELYPRLHSLGGSNPAGYRRSLESVGNIEEFFE